MSGEHHFGTLTVRHHLTPELREVGGHVGYHIVTGWHGRATRIHAAGSTECRRIGLDRVLLTRARRNEASRRLILANGRVPGRPRWDEDRFWITLGDGSGAP